MFAVLKKLDLIGCKIGNSWSPINWIISGGFVHRREMILAHISLAIVVVFILSHSVKWIPNIWELRQAEMDNVSRGLVLHGFWRRSNLDSTTQ